MSMQNERINTETRLQFNTNADNATESKLSSQSSSTLNMDTTDDVESIDIDTQTDRGEVFMMYRHSFSEEVAGVTALGYGTHNGMNTQTAETNTHRVADIVLVSEETTPIASDELIVATTLYNLLNQIVDEEEVVEPVVESLSEPVAEVVEEVEVVENVKEEAPVAALAIGAGVALAAGAVSLIGSDTKEKELIEAASTDDVDTVQEASEEVVVEMVGNANETPRESVAEIFAVAEEVVPKTDPDQDETSVEKVANNDGAAVADAMDAQEEPTEVQHVEEATVIIAADQLAEPKSVEDLVVAETLATDEIIEVQSKLEVGELVADRAEEEPAVVGGNEDLVEGIAHEVVDTEVAITAEAVKIEEDPTASDKVATDRSLVVDAVEGSGEEGIIEKQPAVAPVDQDSIVEVIEKKVVETEMDAAQDVSSNSTGVVNETEAVVESTESETAEEKASLQPGNEVVAIEHALKADDEVEEVVADATIAAEIAIEKTAASEVTVEDTFVNEQLELEPVKGEIIEKAVETTTEDMEIPAEVATPVGSEVASDQTAETEVEEESAASAKSRDVASGMPDIVASLAAGACIVAGGVAVVQINTATQSEQEDVVEPEIKAVAAINDVPKVAAPVPEDIIEEDVVQAKVVAADLVVEAVPVAEVIPPAEVTEPDQVDNPAQNDEASVDNLGAVVEEEVAEDDGGVVTRAGLDGSVESESAVEKDSTPASMKDEIVTPVNDSAFGMAQIVASMAFGAVATATIAEKTTNGVHEATNNETEFGSADGTPALTVEEIVLTDSEEAVIDDLITTTVEEVLSIESSEEQRDSLTLDVIEAAATIESATEDVSEEEIVAEQSAIDEPTDNVVAEKSVTKEDFPIEETAVEKSHVVVTVETCVYDLAHNDPELAVDEPVDDESAEEKLVAENTSEAASDAEVALAEEPSIEADEASLDEVVAEVKEKEAVAVVETTMEEIQLPVDERTEDDIKEPVAEEEEASPEDSVKELAIDETADQDEDCESSPVVEEEVAKAPSSGGWFKNLLFRKKSMPKAEPIVADPATDAAGVHVEVAAAAEPEDTQIDEIVPEPSAAIPQDPARDAGDSSEKIAAVATEMERVPAEIEHQKGATQTSGEQETTLKTVEAEDTDSSVETSEAYEEEIETETAPEEAVVEGYNATERVAETVTAGAVEEAVETVVESEPVHEKPAKSEPIDEEVDAVEKEAANVEPTEDEAVEIAEEETVDAQPVDHEAVKSVKEKVFEHAEEAVAEHVGEDAASEVESTVDEETVAKEVKKDEFEAAVNEATFDKAHAEADVPIEVATAEDSSEDGHGAEVVAEQAAAEAVTVEETVAAIDLATDGVEEVAETVEGLKEDVAAEEVENDIGDNPVASELAAEEVVEETGGAVAAEADVEVADDEEAVEAIAEADPVDAAKNAKDTEPTETEVTTTELLVNVVEKPFTENEPAESIASESEDAAGCTDVTDTTPADESPAEEAADDVAADEIVAKNETPEAAPASEVVQEELTEEERVETDAASDEVPEEEFSVSAANESEEVAEVADAVQQSSPIESKQALEEVVVDEVAEETPAAAIAETEVITPEPDTVADEGSKPTEDVEAPAIEKKSIEVEIVAPAANEEDENSNSSMKYEVDTKPISAVAMLIGRYEQIAARNVASATNSRTSSLRSSRVSSPQPSPPSSKPRENVFETAANSIEVVKAAEKSVEEVAYVEPIKEDTEAEVAEDELEAEVAGSDQNAPEAEAVDVAANTETEEATQDEIAVVDETAETKPEETVEEEVLAVEVVAEETAPEADEEVATREIPAANDEVEPQLEEVATEETAVGEDAFTAQIEMTETFSKREVAKTEIITEYVVPETDNTAAPDATESEATIDEADKITEEEAAEAAVDETQTFTTSYETMESSILAVDAPEDHTPQNNEEDTPSPKSTNDAEPAKEETKEEMSETNKAAVATADFTTDEAVDAYVPVHEFGVPSEYGNQLEEDPSNTSATKATHAAHEESKEPHTAGDNQREEPESPERRMSSILPEPPAVQIDDAAVTNEGTAKATVEMAPMSQATKAVADDATVTERTPERDSTQFLPHEHLTYEILGVTRAHSVIMYHIYTVNSATGERSLSIPKRYSEFKLLAEQLRTLDVPAARELPVLPKPSVGSFLRGRRNKKTIELREKAFGDFLHYVTQHEELHECAVFQQFIAN